MTSINQGTIGGGPEIEIEGVEGTREGRSGLGGGKGRRKGG